MAFILRNKKGVREGP